MIFHANPGVIDLGINIDHVATLRNARGTVYPDPIQAALQAEEAGADLRSEEHTSELQSH